MESKSFMFAIASEKTKEFMIYLCEDTSLNFDFQKINSIGSDVTTIKVSVNDVLDAYWLGKLSERYAKL